ncbi:MAG TPA: hypothetical protein PKA32_02365 [Candidatus Gracilibacteria bacterium]|nr:hypothetical protein [Candidatus Gracilibacteria bacterium]
MKKYVSRVLSGLGGGVLLNFLFVSPALAHVKWFVETEEIVAKETTHYALTDPFVMMWIAVIVLTVLVAFLLDIVLPEPKAKIFKKAEKWKSVIYKIFAITIGVNFLLEAYLGAVFAPPFKVVSTFEFALVGLQVLLGLMLTFGVKVRWAAAGIVLLYLGSMMSYGVMPLLDEVFMIGVAAFLFLEHPESYTWSKEYEAYAIPLLRVFSGIALIVLAFSEKFLHPELGLNFLNEFHWNFMQMLGIADFSNLMFVFSAGAMEFLFGTILILGFIPRINMFATAFFFTITFILLGPIEVIGHMPIFVTALVIILYGGGERLNFRELIPHKKRSKVAALFGR